MGDETVATGEAIAFYTWDFLAAFPGFVLPMPMFFGGEYAIRLEFRDRETGLARGQRSLDVAYRGTTYWLWGLMGVRRCRAGDFAPLAVPLIEEETRRLAQVDEQRVFLTNARALLEADRRLLKALAAGEDPRGPPEVSPRQGEDTASAVLRSTGGSSWGERRQGSGRLRSHAEGVITVSHRSTLNGSGGLQRETSSEGHAKVRWFASPRVTATDGEWTYVDTASTDELLAVAVYLWDPPRWGWRRTGFAPAPAIERALAENEATLRRIEERSRSLGP
jgi:hypothetical protein